MVSTQIVILLMATICFTMIHADRAKRESDPFASCRESSSKTCGITLLGKITPEQEKCYKCSFEDCKQQLTKG
ncbi:Uncharacterised protein r2_g4131 [Pycnogonum litorale]